MSAPCIHAARLCSVGSKRYQLNIARYYARKNWNRRTPLRVMVAGETFEDPRRKLQPSTLKDGRSSKNLGEGNVKVTATGNVDATQSFVYGKRRPFKLPDNIVYERLQEGDRKFGPLVMTAKSKKLRAKDGLILLEGRRLILEAIQCGLTIRNLYFDRLEVLEGLPFEDFKASYYKVTTAHMKVWSDMSTPAGIMALCELPSTEKVLSNQSAVLPITVVCDNIRDPGNMGTILRSAVAVGCEQVLAPKGCVDIWEPKVLRAAAGAHFRCRTVCHMGWEAVGHYLPKDTTVYLADNIACGQDSPKRVSRSLMEAITSVKPDSYTEKDLDTGQLLEIDGTFLRRKVVDLFTNAPLDIQSLFEVEFGSSQHVTVVIGGETEGLSAYAKKLCFDKAGERVYIPMTSQIESLNAGVALSVILFEIKRQMMKVQLVTEAQDIQNVSPP